LRRTKAALIYKKTGNLRAVQLLLGHTKLESTVRYLGVEYVIWGLRLMTLYELPSKSSCNTRGGRYPTAAAFLCLLNG